MRTLSAPVAAVAVAAVALAACFGVHPPDGRYHCDADHGCPDGYACAEDSTCRQLSGGGGGGTDMGAEALAITPTPASVKAGARLHFTTTVEVDWSVSEGPAGGSIAADGTYTAALLPGVYHIAARERAAPQRQGSVAVEVLAWSVDVAAGTLGGVGGADGIGPAARFWSPQAVVSDGGDRLYVADTDNDTIRQVVVSTGAVTTLAGAARRAGSAVGSGAARFDHPMGLALDGQGLLFIANTFDDTIRRLDLPSGVVTHVSGRSKMPGYNDSGSGDWELFANPVGLAFDGANQDLYVADSSNDFVRRIHFASGTHSGAYVDTLSGGDGKAIAFTDPKGLAYDGKGTLYVAEAGTGRVRKVLLGAAPTVSDVADSAGMPVRLQSLYSVAVDDHGRIYFSDWVDPFAVYSVFPDVSLVTTLVGPGTRQRGLGYGGAAQLYVTDETGVGVVTAGGNTSAVRALAGSPPAGDSALVGPKAIAWDGAGAAYVLEPQSGHIRRLDLASFAVTDIAQVTGAPTVRLEQLSCDRQGSLYFVAHAMREPTGTSIQRVALADGAVTVVATAEAGSAGYGALVAGEAGSLYVANGGTILRLPSAGGIATSVADLSAVQALAWDGGGALYAAEGGAIRRINLADGTVVTVAGVIDELGNRNGTGAGARFESPNALAFDPATGTLFVADDVYSIVRRLDVASGTVASWIGVAGVGAVRPGPLPAAVNQPSGLAVIGAGELLITDEHENAVLRVH